MNVSLIIPALNEAPSIGRVLESLPAGVFSEVLVADNGSTDDTAAIAAGHGARVVFQPTRGYGRACLAAMACLAPEADVVVFMDGDASDDPDDVSLLIDPIERGVADLVIGVRHGSRVQARAVMPHQAWGNRLATWLVRRLHGSPCTDLGPFRVVRRNVLEALEMQEPAFGWTVEMQIKALRRGYRVVEVPVAYRPRIGTSKVSGNLGASVRAGVRILATIALLRMR